MKTYLCVEHSDDICRLVANYLSLFNVIKRRYRKSTLVFWVHLEVDILEICIFLMALHRIRVYALAGRIFIVAGCKSPTLFSHLPMYRREWNNVFKSLELPYNQCPMGYMSQILAPALSYFCEQTHPKDRHMRHKDGNGPPQLGIPPPLYFE